ncbi:MULTISPECIES: bifunctional lysylphosphatidylglycerol synthetase/lysine--tRNA ligase LysX [Mycolicibacterium]|jgi:lysyl-tRNA synthetase class 2|uniref:Lysylphosphatidylglycerol biosynthesis bifunctional protein LysX n=3 Tax=Bacteria TaxID=2 RepID=LYSX_MYCVP|nr:MULTISPECIES: bifunctional lysylphosphatidylglycerol synthetase/lysine--tRNA ligase LysX [Mycolicibacterium]A1TAC7.1 RecName: Full=Lysylphosphatidylglycerol biosynthesis bifunctional protein LysX; Includes: RecName: Full=Lysine--tRNA ligase; AltName: Full=Lysyl-tRNA synthetase; Short=LysRS; Includes: RecName: Full=Phosphatidylglycerol lysyltransferase; AltName: Full=Lysylphosphatidylglycerol synthetase; Short=LPG synthetase [Mycolicibacterium vanbaalenii PYR-1]ABM14127.1 lysyl-tRNA synthetase 
MTPTSLARARPTSSHRWVPAAAGWIVGVIATLSLLASVSPLVRSLIRVPREWVDDYIFNFPDTSFAWAFVLALLAAALAARKRIAWWILVGYMIAAAGWNIAGLAEGRERWFAEVGEVIGLAFHLAAIAFLLLARKEFWARVRRGALLKAAATLVASMAVGTLIGWGLLELFPGSLARSDRFLYALNRVSAFAGADAASFSGHPHVFVNALLGLFGAVALMVTAIVLFQSQRADNALTGEDESAIRGLLELYGKNDSLGYFATRRDKAVVFAPSGRAAITYRVEVGVCLASGDPVGDPRSWPQAIDAWLKLCQAYGWAPGVMGASAAGAQAFREAGLNALQLGDEAILHPEDFRLSGPDMRAVRQAVTRARRAGATVRIRRHRELPADEMAAVIERADAWRDTDDERGFSMALGRLGDPADGDCLLVEAVQADQVVAMLSLVPWGGNGVSLDLMRRSPQSPNGTIELMVSELCMQSEDIGITRISLNFAMFRSAFEQGAQLGAGPVARLWRWLLVFFSRWWQLETLYRSNMKYQPEWVPRYACYDDARLVPRVGVASVIAEGFLVLPFSRRHEQPHTGHHIAAPGTLVATGLLHSDGTAPDGMGLQADLADDDQPRLPEQVRVRMAKLKALQAQGVDAYPVANPPSHTVAQALAAEDGADVAVAGRVLRSRDYGGVLFAQLRDWSGETQLVLDNSLLADGSTADFTRTIDLGDLIEVTGTMGRSRSGKWSLLVSGWRLIGKCLRPLPDKWKGLTDQEARVRARYVDLAVNTDARELIRARSAVLHAIRETLVAKDFLEVETPILQQIHGGANARPFLTHINAYDLDLYLRIAPELYLKRLCVGGVERVFELGRAFRNEGVDFSHNPEFTLLEAYQAHADYHVWIDGCRELIQNAAQAANGAQVFMRPRADGVLEPVDISGPWTVKTVHGAVSEALGEQIGPDTDLATLRLLCDRAGIPYLTHWDAGAVVLELYEHLVEDQTREPTFYKDFPTSVSPLTRPHRSIPGVAERWDLVAWGVELGTAYSELTDPVEQRRRLQEQSLLAAGGDPEAMELDEDFLQAMEYAMPPTGGLGMGVDRVVMLITGRSIRETLPFPLAKPR